MQGAMALSVIFTYTALASVYPPVILSCQDNITNSGPSWALAELCRPDFSKWHHIVKYMLYILVHVQSLGFGINIYIYIFNAELCRPDFLKWHHITSYMLIYADMLDITGTQSQSASWQRCIAQQLTCPIYSNIRVRLLVWVSFPFLGIWLDNSCFLVGFTQPYSYPLH